MLISDGGGKLPTPVMRDTDRIHVRISNDGASFDVTDIGTATQALADKHVTAAERTAIRNILAGMEEIRSQVAPGSGVAQAIDGVKGITLRVNASPAANQGHVLVPPTNPFITLKGSDAKPNVLYPRDVALHELTHLVQEGVSGEMIGSRGGREQRGMGGPTNVNAVSVGEGLADSEAMLTTKSTSSGGEYFGPKGIYKSVRDFAHPSGDKHVLTKVSTNFNEVNHNVGDPHEYGGVVAEIFLEVSKKSSNAQALAALNGVLEDPAFAASNQGWWELRDSLKLQADAARNRADPVLAAAIETSLNDHGLSTTE